MTIEIKIRPYKDKDLAFCRDSFYKGGASAPEYAGIDPNILKPGLRARFDRFSRFAEIAVACEFEHEEPLFGWIAYTNLGDHSILWWVYVKAGYRNFGFARQMIEECLDSPNILYPFRSRASNSFALSIDAKHHPFLLDELLDRVQNED